jgi:hypothetical protein
MRMLFSISVRTIKGRSSSAPRSMGEPATERRMFCARMDDLEWDYWMGTEVGQLGGYGFQGAIFGVDGSCKDDTMGSGCCKFQEEEADKCARVGREEEGTNSNRLEFGGIVLALQSAALSEDVLLLCDNTAVLCAVKSGYDKEERRR